MNEDKDHKDNKVTGKHVFLSVVIPIYNEEDNIDPLYAEIIAAVVLAGEISLASAISSLDWVSSHEQYGRNR